MSEAEQERRFDYVCRACGDHHRDSPWPPDQGFCGSCAFLLRCMPGLLEHWLEHRWRYTHLRQRRQP